MPNILQLQSKPTVRSEHTSETSVAVQLTLAQHNMSDSRQGRATFGAGCFWGVEAAFRRTEGVIDTAVGYAGGNTVNPTYKEVCTGRTLHAEVVQITYDPDRISYDALLDIFWSNHNPTTRNRQGPDVGTQYRSAIFFHNQEQEIAARQSQARWQASFKRPIVTEISPAGPFYKAEDYHQQYLERRGLAHCHIG